MSGAAEIPAPRATYRLQFDPAFGFAKAAELAPYLAALGISHVYLAPVFAARPGSTHGYDVVDPTRINPELGGETGFRDMVATFRAAGLGIILDIVPNHMGIGTDNAYWQSVLREGPASPYAHWFDIDWNAPFAGLEGRVLLPILGKSYGAALSDGDLALRSEDGVPAVWAHDTHRLPLRPEDEAMLRDPAELARVAADPEALGALIGRQHWRVAKFDLDRGVMNYRRFFTVSDLAGVRVELPEVFEATHALIFYLLREGLVDGLRVDHIDGLHDPAGYARRLRAASPRPVLIWVEKILAHDERLPESWGVDGTTGYEFANLINGLMIDPCTEREVDRAYAAFLDHPVDPLAATRAAKIEIMTGRMAGELRALLAEIEIAARGDLRTRDLNPEAIREALLETVAALEVYRTYADANGLGPGDHERLSHALDVARAIRSDLGAEVHDFLAALLLLGRAEGLPILRRLQQFSGPVMAKGLEDTTLYRYNRLISLNEVGSEPGRYAVSPAEFHAANAERLRATPRALLAASTHDTKRGEDARARIAAIAADATAWQHAASRWHAMLADPEEPLDPNEVWFFFQLLLGAWPMDWRAEYVVGDAELARFRDRVTDAMLKSVREASVNTRWVHGDPDYEAALSAYVARALDSGAGNAFLADFRAVEAGLFARGVANGLTQLALRMTVPGVPDIYRGAELWEQSLVDPDNRRPVDFAARAVSRAAPPGARGLGSGAAKLALIAALLGHRATHPVLYATGDYLPIHAEDPRVLAFARQSGEDRIVVVAALPGAADVPDLGAFGLVGLWRDLVSPAVKGDPSARPFSAAPVAVLVRG